MSGGADEITRDIVTWARAVVPELDVAARPLRDEARGAGVDIRLVGLSPRQTPRTSNPPAAIDLDYLITVQMDDAFAEQKALGELLFASAERSDFDVVPTRSAAAICADLGIPVAAGFVVRIVLVRERERGAAPLVREPMRVDTAAIGVVEGQVLGPGDVPVANAVVSLPGSGREVRTNARGQFRITGAPHNDRGTALNVRARGVETTVEATPGQHVVLRLPLEV